MIFDYFVHVRVGMWQESQLNNGPRIVITRHRNCSKNFSTTTLNIFSLWTNSGLREGHQPHLTGKLEVLSNIQIYQTWVTYPLYIHDGIHIILLFTGLPDWIHIILLSRDCLPDTTEKNGSAENSSNLVDQKVNQIWS